MGLFQTVYNNKREENEKSWDCALRKTYFFFLLSLAIIRGYKKYPRVTAQKLKNPNQNVTLLIDFSLYGPWAKSVFLNLNKFKLCGLWFPKFPSQHWGIPLAEDEKHSEGGREVKFASLLF